jgi:hypothetical protein
MSVRTKIICVAVAYPLTVCVLGLIPPISPLFFSLHGGIGWLLAPAAFPWFIAGLAVHRTKELPFGDRLPMLAGSIIGYFIITGAASLVISKNLEPLGAEVSPRMVWAAFNMPMGLAAR